jgi:hypothetical protein
VFDCISVDRQFCRLGALFVVKSYRAVFWQHILMELSTVIFTWSNGSALTHNPRRNYSDRRYIYHIQNKNEQIVTLTHLLIARDKN